MQIRWPTLSKLNHNIPFVDLDTAFATFGPKTQRDLRNVISELSTGFAGRGAQFNDSIYSLDRLIGPLDNLLSVLIAPDTHLSEFISGLASTTGALASVAPTISALLADGATTFDALQRSALGQTLDLLPPTESLGTTVLTNAQPVLTDAATIVQDLKPGAALLPTAAQRLDAIITSATPVFKQVPRLATLLETALVTVDELARDPASTRTFAVLGSTDLASLGASAFVGLGAILRTVAPAQFACNTTGIWVRNFASSLSEGDNTGAWLRFAAVLALSDGQMFAASKPSSDLHLNYYPTENSSECQAGNEPYKPGQVIGNPGPTSTVTDNTSPPAGVLARGRAAGLVP